MGDVVHLNDALSDAMNDSLNDALNDALDDSGKHPAKGDHSRDHGQSRHCFGATNTRPRLAPDLKQPDSHR